jgi:D,D-heptose 1,7-bisphosphate phosphatase
LIVDHPYSSDPDRIELLDGAVDGLLALQQAGYLLVVLTNQSGVARGFYGEAAIRRMHRRLDAMLGRAGVEVAAYYYCPHHVDGVVRSLARPCFCRKPEPGMLFRAARDWAIDLGQSWMLGDLTSDVAAGRAAGCRTLLIGDRDAGAGARVPNLREAAKVIVAEGGA